MLLCPECGREIVGHCCIECGYKTLRDDSGEDYPFAEDGSPLGPWREDD